MNNESPILLIFELGIQIERMNQRLESEEGLSVTQWSILKHLVDSPACSARALARLAGVQPATLTQSLKRLQKKGMIVVATDPTDRRRKIISVTRGGVAALDKVEIRFASCLTNRSFRPHDLRRVKDQIGDLFDRARAPSS